MITHVRQEEIGFPNKRANDSRSILIRFPSTPSGRFSLVRMHRAVSSPFLFIWKERIGSISSQYSSVPLYTTMWATHETRRAYLQIGAPFFVVLFRFCGADSVRFLNLKIFFSPARLFMFDALKRKKENEPWKRKKEEREDQALFRWVHGDKSRQKAENGTVTSSKKDQRPAANPRRSTFILFPSFFLLLAVGLARVWTPQNKRRCCCCHRVAYPSHPKGRHARTNLFNFFIFFYFLNPRPPSHTHTHKHSPFPARYSLFCLP